MDMDRVRVSDMVRNVDKLHLWLWRTGSDGFMDLTRGDLVQCVASIAGRAADYGRYGR